MDDVMLVKVAKSRYELASYFLYWLYRHGSTLFFQVLLHILSLHKLKYDVKLVVLGIWVELSHEIFVLYYRRVDEGLGYVELIIHIFHCLVSELSVVVYLSYFVHELARNSPNLDLEDVALGSRA